MNDISRYLTDRLDKSLEISRTASGVAVGLMIPFAGTVIAAHGRNDQLIRGFWSPEGFLVTLVIAAALALWTSNLLLQDKEQRRLVRTLWTAAAQQAEVDAAKAEVKLVLDSKPLWRKRRGLLCLRLCAVMVPLAILWADLVDALPCQLDPSCRADAHADQTQASAAIPLALQPAPPKDAARVILNGAGLRDARSFRAGFPYLAKLYLEALSRDGASLLGSSQHRQVALTFTRALTAENISNAFNFALNGLDDCEAEKLDSLKKTSLIEVLLADIYDDASAPKTESGERALIGAGDTLRFDFTGSSVAISHNGLAPKTVADPATAKALLAVYIGDCAVDPGLKAALLEAAD